MKKKLLILCATLLSLAVVGCGKTKEETKPTEPVKESIVTIDDVLEAEKEAEASVSEEVFTNEYILSAIKERFKGTPTENGDGEYYHTSWSNKDSRTDIPGEITIDGNTVVLGETLASEVASMFGLDITGLMAAAEDYTHERFVCDGLEFYIAVRNRETTDVPFGDAPVWSVTVTDANVAGIPINVGDIESGMNIDEVFASKMEPYGVTAMPGMTMLNYVMHDDTYSLGVKLWNGKVYEFEIYRVNHG